MKQYFFPFTIACMLLIMCEGCKQKTTAVMNEVEILHQNQDILTQVIIYDVFTPPVASRIYVYSSLASYEALRFGTKGAASIAERLNGFGKMPVPQQGKTYNYTLAATKAFFTVVRNIKVFSVDSLLVQENAVYKTLKRIWTTLPTSVQLHLEIPPPK